MKQSMSEKDTKYSNTVK